MTPMALLLGGLVMLGLFQLHPIAALVWIGLLFAWDLSADLRRYRKTDG